MQPVFVLLLLLNVWTFFLFGWDKWLASRGKRRISEARLLMQAFAFGAAGAWLGVLVFRHKRAKPSFLLWLAMATGANAVLAWIAASSWPSRG